MKRISFPDLKPGEFAFLFDAGRAVRVQVSEVADFNAELPRKLGMPENGPEQEGDHYLVFQATVVNVTTGAAPAGASTDLQGREIKGHLITSGQDSHEEHWKLHSNEPDPNMNPVAPEGLAAGKVIDDANGADWYAGYGHPDKVLPETDGAEGDYYVDLTNGCRYKCRQGLLVWHASVIAAGLDRRLTTIADRAAIGLPKI